MTKVKYLTVTDGEYHKVPLGLLIHSIKRVSSKGKLKPIESKQRTGRFKVTNGNPGKELKVAVEYSRFPADIKPYKKGDPDHPKVWPFPSTPPITEAKP